MDQSIARESEANRIITLIKDLISNLGFPIVMVGYFIWDKTKVTNKLVEVINNNNVILNKLISKLDRVVDTDDLTKGE